MKKIIHTLFNYIPVLLAFLLPFGGRLLSLLVILWFVVSWFCFDWKKFKDGFKNKWFLLLFGFFVFHLISGLLSKNFPAASTSVEVKFSFLAFPYFVFLFGLETATVKKIMIAFVSGCLFALLFCLGRAGYYFFSEGQNYFYYNAFSYLIHPSYFSMYLLTSIVILQLAYPIWFEKDAMNKPIRLGYTLFFILGIVLCASKMGIIAFFITALIILAIRFKEKLSFKNGAIVLLLMGALTFTTYKIIPTPFERLISAFNTTTNEAEIDKTSSESTAVRILIWEQCVNIIKENFIFGVGGGDANDVLQNKYKENGLTGALSHNLNAHNQYFQTFIALGVLGFLMLFMATLGTIIYGLMQKNSFLFIFSIIIVLNFLVESMLQTQAGNLFYVYFLCLFLRYDPQRLVESNTHTH